MSTPRDRNPKLFRRFVSLRKRSQSQPEVPAGAPVAVPQQMTAAYSVRPFKVPKKPTRTTQTDIKAPG